MRILVTGGSGFIGSHLCFALQRAGHGVDILDVRAPERIAVVLRKDIREDLTDWIKGYDAVYHLAAVANARVCGQRPRDAYEINVMGTYNVLEACHINNIPRVLYASTTWMAGMQVPRQRPVSKPAVHEEDPFKVQDMNTIYGATKLSGELMFHAYLAEKKAPRFTIMRYGIPYGEGMWDGLVVRAFMAQAEKHGVITIYGDGHQGRNFLYVGDMCDAQVKLLDKRAAGETYHLGSPEFVSIKEIAEEVRKHFPAKLNYITQARVEPKVKNVSSMKAGSDFGWEPTTSLEEGIARCAKWWKALDPDLKEDVPYYVP